MAVRYSTSYRLWGLFATVAFAALGCAPIITYKSGVQSVWGLGRALVFGELGGPQIEYAKWCWDMLWHSSYPPPVLAGRRRPRQWF